VCRTVRVIGKQTGDLLRVRRVQVAQAHQGEEHCAGSLEVHAGRRQTRGAEPRSSATLGPEQALLVEVADLEEQTSYGFIDGPDPLKGRLAESESALVLVRLEIDDLLAENREQAELRVGQVLAETDQ